MAEYGKLSWNITVGPWCSIQVMCCVMVKSRQCRSEKMRSCSHTRVVDNRVGIVLGTDKVVSFVVEKEKVLSIPHPHPPSNRL